MQIYFAIPPNSAFYGLLEEYLLIYQRREIFSTLVINLLGNNEHFPTVPKLSELFQKIVIYQDIIVYIK